MKPLFQLIACTKPKKESPDWCVRKNEPTSSCASLRESEQTREEWRRGEDGSGGCFQREVNSLVECARGQGLTACHTPLPTIIAPTTSTKTIKRLTREDGKSKQGGNIWVSPHRPRFDIPHPLFFRIMPFSFQRCTIVAGCGFILIDVRIYMMPNYDVPNSMIYHQQLPLLPKHTQPNRWWGFCL